MNIITVKALLIDAPAPTFVGTRMGVAVADGQTFEIAKFQLDDTAVPLTVNWGDGSVETIARSGSLSHAYEVGGNLLVEISDNMKSFGFTCTSSSPFAPLMTSLHCNSPKLTALEVRAFGDCVNLRTVDVEQSGLTALRPSVFANCKELRGELRFPKVIHVYGANTNLPFYGCTGGITAFHFSASAEETIRTGTAYQSDPTLGTGTAVCLFDL